MDRWVTRHYTHGVALLEGAAVLFSLFVLIPRDVPFLAMLALLVAAVVPWLILYLACAKRVNRDVAYALEEMCDPLPLLSYSRECIRQFDRRGTRRRPALLSYRLNEATALTGLGLDGEAIAVLDGLEPRLPEKADRYRLLYALNRCAVCCQLGRLDEAETLLAQAGPLMDTVAPKDPLYPTYHLVLQADGLALALLRQGPTPQIEAGFAALLESASTQRMRVIFHVSLGKCAQARGALEEARAHFTYAARHGNRLFARQEAETQLSRLA